MLAVVTSEKCRGLPAVGWFALAPRERDKAMMLSQLTFRESESLTKAGAAREEST